MGCNKGEIELGFLNMSKVSSPNSISLSVARTPLRNYVSMSVSDMDMDVSVSMSLLVFIFHSIYYSTSLLKTPVCLNFCVCGAD